MEHDVGKETECETSVMSRGRPTRREGPGQLDYARLCSPLHTDFRAYISLKTCMMHIILKTYEASQMGMRLASLAAIVSLTTHKGHQPSVWVLKGWMESGVQREGVEALLCKRALVGE